MVRVEYLNANWNGSAAAGSAFELLVVTEGGERHVLPITAADLAALGSLLRPDLVLLFDPGDQTLIVANLIGQWIQPEWSSGTARRGEPPREDPGRPAH